MAADQVREFPDDAQADGPAHRRQYKGNPAAELFALPSGRCVFRLSHCRPSYPYIRITNTGAAWE